MIAPLTQHEFEKIRDLLVSVCGITLDDDQDYLIETRLTDLGNCLNANNFTELHRMMVSSMETLSKVIDLMTTNETLWFRDVSFWNTLEKKVIPEMFKKLEAGANKINIWSAACSTGQEPYSLTMLIKEYADKNNCNHLVSKFKILATDISKQALFLANQGKYDSFTIKRGLSEERKQKYFTQKDHGWALSNEIKQQVEFRSFNLMENFILLGSFDIIFLRNVAIYFSNEFRTSVFDKTAKVLNPDGYFFLGATESMMGLKTCFCSHNFENGIYFKLTSK